MTKSRGLRTPYQRFSEADDAVLRLRYPDEAASVIANDLGKTVGAVHRRAYRLELKKSEAFKASDMSGRIKRGHTDPRMIKARFPPGHVPANKGLRRPGWSSGRMCETQFQKGRPAREAHNYVPIGTEKVDKKRKVLMRKMTDDPSIFPVNRWRPVHVMVWESVHGAVPPGHIVIFKHGRKTFVADEITIDRLELVTLAENMRRNTIHVRLPPELRQIVQLNGVLKRKINNRSHKA